MLIYECDMNALNITELRFTALAISYYKKELITRTFSDTLMQDYTKTIAEIHRSKI